MTGKKVIPQTTQSASLASSLQLVNRQRTHRLNVRLLREITLSVLDALPGVDRWDLLFYFVGRRRIAELNEEHLGHEGPTDVITFDYNDPAAPGYIAGEIFICVEVAVSQAREFRTTWQSEVARYVIHSLLHLCGHDDLQPAARRKMKQVENRLLRKLERQFKLSQVGA